MRLPRFRCGVWPVSAVSCWGLCDHAIAGVGHARQNTGSLRLRLSANWFGRGGVVICFAVRGLGDKVVLLGVEGVGPGRVWSSMSLSSSLDELGQ